MTPEELTRAAAMTTALGVKAAGRERVAADASPQHYSSGDLVEVANIINDVDKYRSVEDCARAIIPAVLRLVGASPQPSELIAAAKAIVDEHGYGATAGGPDYVAFVSCNKIEALRHALLRVGSSGTTPDYERIEAIRHRWLVDLKMGGGAYQNHILRQLASQDVEYLLNTLRGTTPEPDR